MGGRAGITAASDDNDVRVTGMLGQGSQGKVMSGIWKGVKVAYKITQLPVMASKQGKAETRALMEMAISATMSHPNVVQTFSYSLKQIKCGVAAPPSQASMDSSSYSSLYPPGSASDILKQGSQLLDTSPASAADLGGTQLWEARLIQVPSPPGFRATPSRAGST